MYSPIQLTSGIYENGCAASEWFEEAGSKVDAPIVFAAFGAGLNWGALLAFPV